MRFFNLPSRTALLIDDVVPVTICRDPKDDKFLALGITGDAEIILTGDLHLLALNPFRGIAILSPRSFLDRLS